jgi:hypothetical protein
LLRESSAYPNWPIKGGTGLGEKKLDWPVERKRELIEAGQAQLSVRRQCELLGLPRASLYYEPTEEGAENLLLMRLLDEQYTATPFYGVRRMTAWLRSQGYAVNHKRVGRLLRQMGMAAIYPGPKLSQPGGGMGSTRTYCGEQGLSGRTRSGSRMEPSTA